MAIGLITHKKIVTTEAKAKALRPYIERLITKARTPSLSARRTLLGILANEKAVKTLITDIAPKYKSRKGGYTRVIKLGRRVGDGGSSALIELV